MLEVKEHQSSKYSPRTYHNATSSDITIAFAIDFETMGEKLTHKAAGTKYLGIPLSEEPIQAARIIYRSLKKNNLILPTINIAGNGIYTLKNQGWDQNKINMYIFTVIQKINEFWKIKKIISGGQTGVDMAGIVAAETLMIDSCATLPKGFIQRGIDKKDKEHTQEEIKNEIKKQVDFITNEIRKKYTFFWGEKDVFSNFYESEFEIDNKKFKFVEKYMMYKKAELFGDLITAEKIFKATTPAQCKALGRQVKNFDEKIWNENKEKIVKDGIRAKIEQNDLIKQKLLETGDTILVEASPKDCIWGVGLAENDQRIIDKSNWRGLNLLGKQWMEIKNELKNENRLTL